MLAQGSLQQGPVRQAHQPCRLPSRSPGSTEGEGGRGRVSKGEREGGTEREGFGELVKERSERMRERNKERV